MREALKDPGRIHHMLEMAELLESEKSKHSLQTIQEDKILFFGLTKMVEIIGEAAYMVTKEFKETNPELPWKQMEGMRHVLVHGYYTVRPEVLWSVIENDIPSIIPTLRILLEKANKNLPTHS